MPRIRSIHPGIFTDRKFMGLSNEARVLLIGIWCHAWDDGVFKWDELELKARILPCDNVNIPDLLDELRGQDLVRIFEIDGCQHGAVRNFQKYQKPKKPSVSGNLPEDLEEYVASSEAKECPDRALRKELCEEQGGKCAYCKTDITHFRKRWNSLEIDHVIPKSRGGNDARENLVASCRNCNRSKGDKTRDEFMEALAARAEIEFGTRVADRRGEEGRVVPSPRGKTYLVDSESGEVLDAE